MGERGEEVGGLLLGEEGWGVTLGAVGGGHRCTAAKLMLFFSLCSGSEKQSVVAH